MTLRMTLVGAVALLAAQGCAPHPVGETVVSAPAASAQPKDGREFATLLGSILKYDYDPEANPAALRHSAELVVDGTIESLVDGRVIEPFSSGAQRNMVLTIRPRTVHKAPGATRPALVHVEFRRPDNQPTSFYAASVPIGGRIVLFADAHAERRDPEGDQYAGRAPGQPMFGAHPQGLFLDVDGRPFSVYTHSESDPSGFDGVHTFEDLTRSIEGR